MKPPESLSATLVGSKRTFGADEPHAASVSAPSVLSAKRQRCWLLPFSSTTPLLESVTCYHKLVEFEQRMDVTIKHHRQFIDARLRAVGLARSGETAIPYPVAPLNPIVRVLRFHVDVQQDTSFDQQTRWVLRLWGSMPDGEDESADLSHHLLKVGIQTMGCNPPVAIDWQPVPGARPTYLLILNCISQICAQQP